MKVFWQVNKLAKDDASKFNRFGHVFVLFSLFIIFILDIAVGSQYDIGPNTPNDYKVQKNIEPLTYLSVRGNKIFNQKGKEINLRGVHYDCFYLLPKKVHDAIKQANEDPDLWNIKFSEAFFTENDITRIKNLGANVVRLEFRLWEIEKKPYSYSYTSLAHLDETIAKLGENRHGEGIIETQQEVPVLNGISQVIYDQSYLPRNRLREEVIIGNPFHRRQADHANIFLPLRGLFYLLNLYPRFGERLFPARNKAGKIG